MGTQALATPLPVPLAVLTVTLQSVAGSTSVGAKLRITLAGYGSTAPTIVNSLVMGAIGGTYTIPASGTLSVPLYGNDVLSPAGTYYCVQMLDPKGNVLAATNYKLVGSGELDVSNLLPYDPTLSEGIFYVATLNNRGPQGPQGLPGGLAGTMVPQVPAGAIDGVNLTYQLSSAASYLFLFRNGVFQRPGVDYTFQGSSFVYVVPMNPATANDAADNHYCMALVSIDVDGMIATAVATAVAAALAAPTTGTGTATSSALYLLGDDGNTYQLQSVNAEFTTAEVALPAGVSAPPTSLPILDTNNGNTYLITVVGGEETLTLTSAGTTPAPQTYPTVDTVTGVTYQVRSLDGQISLASS